MECTDQLTNIIALVGSFIVILVIMLGIYLLTKDH